MTVDVVVVGAGLAGLTAATYAARSGARVVVLESTTRPGGRARTECRDGISFNQGPHALYEGGAGMDTLRDLGIDPPGARPSATGPAVWCGREGPLPFDARSLATTKLLTRRSRLAFARFHTGLARLDARSFDSTSVADFLDDSIGTARGDLRAVVEGILRLSLYANAPELHSAGAAIDQLKLAGSGVRYLHQGWGALVDSLAFVARLAGAEIQVGARVVAIEPAADVAGADTSDGHADASAAAAADVAAGANSDANADADADADADAADASMRIVVDGDGRRWSTHAVIIAGLSPDAAERLARSEPGALRAAAGPPVRAACLDLVLATPPKVTFALDLDHHGYYSLHAPVADLASGGRALVSLARYRRPDEVTDAERDRTTMREFARRMGVETTLTERYLHDMTVTHGMPLATRGGLAGRPQVDALGQAGLLLAGDWVGPSGLLADAALASGRAAGRLAAGICGRRGAAQ